MSGQVAVDSGPSLAEVGAQMIKMRAERGLSQEDVAGILSVSQPVVSMIENGKYNLQGKLRTTVLGVLSLGARDGHLPWFVTYLKAEQEATSLRGWEGPVIPGLFQTGEYARHVLAAAAPGISAAELDRQVAARMTRHAIWQREEPPPPVMSVIIGEYGLRQMVGGPGVMRGQMERLLVMSEHPCVRIRVLPQRAGGSVGLLPSFMLASFAPEPRPDLAYLDDALIGRTSVNRSQVAKLGLVYDRIAGEALSPRESSALIRKVAAEWATTN